MGGLVAALRAGLPASLAVEAVQRQVATSLVFGIAMETQRTVGRLGLSRNPTIEALRRELDYLDRLKRGY